jgi:TolA-binding protein
MKISNFFFLAALLPVVALSNEPSAYGAGDLDAKTPYGLSQSEKRILQNNEKVSNLNQTVGNVKSELGKVSEDYEGVRSVIDCYGNKIAKLDERLRQLEQANEELRTENTQLKEYVTESRKIQTENQEKVKAVLTELGSVIDSINKNYVPKDKFDQLQKDVKSKSASSATSKSPDETHKEKVVSSKDLSSKDSATLMKEADDFFDKKSFKEAKVYYDELLKRNYKPAKHNYNLGEISYNTKSYTEAIEYYKTSISLFDKASYTPSLLYHTGVSFEKLGKAKDAQTFYKALKQGYPDSPEAKKVK